MWRRGRAGAGLIATRGASRTGRRCRPVQTECRIRCRRGGDERGSCRRSDLTGGKHGEWVGVSDEWSKGDPGRGWVRLMEIACFKVVSPFAPPSSAGVIYHPTVERQHMVLDH